MANTVMYTVAIATLSILLIGVLALDAEAKNSDTVTVVQKGHFADFNLIDFDSDGFIGKIFVGIEQMNDSKDIRVSYFVLDHNRDRIADGQDCISSKQILQVSSMKKASIKFDTADLVNCDVQSGLSGEISATLIATDEKPKKENTDITICGTSCVRVHGYDESISATAVATAFGITVDKGSASFGNFNIKTTTSPPP